MATTVNVNSSQGRAYTWGDARFAWSDPDGGKTWDTATPTVYTLSVGEGWATEDAWNQRYSLKPQEGWHTAEAWSQDFALPVGEAWRTRECWTDIWLPWLRISESCAITETTLKSMFMAKAEGWAVTEEACRQSQILGLEGWATGDAWHPQFGLNLSEGWTAAELAAKLMTHISREAFQTTDSPPVWEAVKAIAESCNTAETYHEITQFNYRAAENITFEEKPVKHTARPFAESFRTMDSWEQSTIKDCPESLVTVESLENTAQFQRIISEAFHAAEAIAKVCDITPGEAFSVLEAYLRNANAVMSDIAFGTGDLSLEDFLKMNSPVGYTPFTAFVPGELEYQKALISLVINGPLTTGRPKIIDWRLTVDVPDQTDSGTCTIPAANTFIPFSRRFFAPPEVLVQLRGGSSGTPDITGVTDAGYYLQINGENGQPVAGDVVWSAVGY